MSTGHLDLLGMIHDYQCIAAIASISCRQLNAFLKCYKTRGNGLSIFYLTLSDISADMLDQLDPHVFYPNKVINNKLTCLLILLMLSFNFRFMPQQNHWSYKNYIWCLARTLTFCISIFSSLPLWII